jgi:2-oxoglutarate ferredoxin oxidoreductase subunit beta
MSEKVKVYGIPERKFPLPVSLCPGCGHGIIGHLIYEALMELGVWGKAIMVGGVGCAAMPMAGLGLDNINCTHGTAPAVATGIKRVHGREAVVLTLQGDGDCASIGAGQLLNAAVRAENITVIMANNAVYGTTGGQMGPTTLVGQVTTTTPSGRDPKIFGYPLHAAELMATIKGVAYSARGSVDSPANYRRVKGYLKTAFQKQLDEVGLGFVEVLSCCPTDWHLSPVEALKWVEEKMIPEFPLGEYKSVDKIE